MTRSQLLCKRKYIDRESENEDVEGVCFGCYHKNNSYYISFYRCLKRMTIVICALPTPAVWSTRTGESIWLPRFHRKSARSVWFPVTAVMVHWVIPRSTSTWWDLYDVGNPVNGLMFCFSCRINPETILADIADCASSKRMIIITNHPKKMGTECWIVWKSEICEYGL